MKPRLRRPDLVKQDPHRDYLRENCPTGAEGFVAEDLDLVARRFGSRFGTDADGQFVLVEVKHGSAPLGRSKEMTFKMIDDLLSASDPWAERYLGMFTLRHFHDGDEPWSDGDPVVFGKSPMTAGDYRKWLLGENIPFDVTPMFAKVRKP